MNQKNQILTLSLLRVRGGESDNSFLYQIIYWMLLRKKYEPWDKIQFNYAFVSRILYKSRN